MVKTYFMPKNQQLIHNLIRFDTPLGEMLVCISRSGICRLEYTGSIVRNDHNQDKEEYANTNSSAETISLYNRVRHQLEEYFHGKRREFTIPLVPEGTEFQRRVWRELQKIPYGSTRTYLQHAVALNSPKAIRAVAAANARNPIAILIPCHRVVGAKGELTGYAGGLSRKQWLLDLEKITVGERLSLF